MVSSVGSEGRGSQLRLAALVPSHSWKGARQVSRDQLYWVRCNRSWVVSHCPSLEGKEIEMFGKRLTLGQAGPPVSMWGVESEGQCTSCQITPNSVPIAHTSSHSSDCGAQPPPAPPLPLPHKSWMTLPMPESVVSSSSTAVTSITAPALPQGIPSHIIG